MFFQFLPTPSARRATEAAEKEQRGKFISTHALREEGDDKPIPVFAGVKNFYPRPPRGGRLQAVGLHCG